ncbi:hypothetical protein [Frankia tisae]|uniref:hypothetical protein n=1 Tax=Frankia tisae TaxID=2950104 RepID=UPI0021BE9230|nr:hypothetical protein [Frankia tisae]
MKAVRYLARWRRAGEIALTPAEDEAARRRIDAALAAESETPEVSPAPEPTDSHPRPIRSQPETTGLDRTPPAIAPAEPEPLTGPAPSGMTCENGL